MIPLQNCNKALNVVRAANAAPALARVKAARAARKAKAKDGALAAVDGDEAARRCQ